MKLSSLVMAVLLICLGAAVALLGVLSARADRECPSLLAVSELVDGCFADNRRACELLVQTICRGADTEPLKQLTAYK